MRTRLSLNGTWDFVADLDPKYHAVHGGFHRPEANRRHWLKVPVPGVWQTYAERYRIYEGVCWLAREFEVPEAAGGASARLRFGAVNYQATVYLNGERVGSHEGGYTEFVLDVSGRLRPGINHVAVQVDNRATSTKWPPCLGYFNYGGIHRAVSLEIGSGAFLDDLTLTAAAGQDPWELAVSGRVRGVPAAVSEALVVRVSSSGHVAEERQVGNGDLTVRLPLPGVPAWSPETPHLQVVVVELLDPAGCLLDRQEFACGCRTLAMHAGQVQLNGRPYRLQGVCYVYDSPVSGLVMTPGQIETDLRLMKAAGCNAVRCHYPMDPVFYEACDRLGLLVWIEPPVYCYHPGDEDVGTRFADPAWLALAQEMAREMVAVARNHPSVAIYSIGNECNTRNPEAEAFFRALAATLREADSTRLLAYAALYGTVGPIATLVDLIGINSYYGWYDLIWQDGNPQPREPGGGSDSPGTVARRPIDLTPLRALLEEVLGRNPGVALLLTEFGADAVPGYRSASRDLWSEDYQADLLRALFSVAAEYPRIVGTFPFCFSDYRDPSKLPNGYWNEHNLKGVVDYQRNPKAGLAALRESYRQHASEAGV